MGKILKINQIKKSSINSSDKKIVLVGGCFDILHIGHIIFLEKAKQAADTLVVLLESDETIKKLKGKNRPINSQEDRARILSSLIVVDFVVTLPVMSDQDYDRIIKEIKPNLIATSREDKDIKHKIRAAKLVQAKVKYVTSQIEDRSTTNLIKLLSAKQ